MDTLVGAGGAARLALRSRKRQMRCRVETLLMPAVCSHSATARPEISFMPKTSGLEA